MATKSDLEKAFDTITAKAASYTLLWEYYDGEQPLRYSAERLRAAFKDSPVRFVENWCAVVVDSVSDRLNFKGFAVTDDETANEFINDIYNSQKMSTDVYDAHEAALVCGEAFMIVWPGKDGKPEEFYNDPRMVHIFYDGDNPKVKSYAAKMWLADDRYKMNLYYRDRIEHYQTIEKSDPQWPSSAKAFSPIGEDYTDQNDYDMVPVFHVRTKRRKPVSEFSNAISIQDAVNKLFSDMMVSSEFGSFPQRWIISNADVSNLKNAPWEVWKIPAGDGEGQSSDVGQFAAAELANFYQTMDKLARAIAIITRTPKHYFAEAGANISGDALVALEAPLNKKVDRYKDLFDDTWVEVAEFIFKIAGMTVDPTQIKPVWGRSATVQPISEATARQANVNSGIPLETVLTLEGWTEKDIEKLREDKAAEQAAAQSSLARALLEAERNFNRGDGERTEE